MRKGFVIHHNGPRAHCVGRSHSRCEAFWQGVTDWHIRGNGWSRNAYSFGVCPHGIIFVANGWDRAQFANGADQVGVDDGRDSQWYTVLCFVGGGAHGGFDTGEPEEDVTDPMRIAVEQLIEEGRRTKRCDRRVLPHNVFKRKACPGPTLTKLAIRLDNGAVTPAVSTIQEDEDMTAVLVSCRTTPGSDENMHTYVVENRVGVWCKYHSEIRAAEFFGAVRFGPVDPDVWKTLQLTNGPLANDGRRS